MLARTITKLPHGTRIADYISVGVLARAFWAVKVRSALEATQRDSVRQRNLPAHVVVYYLIALASLKEHSPAHQVAMLQRAENPMPLLAPGVSIQRA